MISVDTARAYVIQLLELIEAKFPDRSDAPHRKGYDFERRFAAMCEGRGLHTVRSPRGHFDFVVNGLRVQCKCLTPNEKGIFYLAPGNYSAYEPLSFDALAVEVDGRLHLIPEEDIPRVGSKGLLRTNNHVSFLQPYLDAWWVLERSERPAGFVRQLALWGIDEETTNGR